MKNAYEELKKYKLTHKVTGEQYNVADLILDYMSEKCFFIGPHYIPNWIKETYNIEHIDDIISILKAPSATDLEQYARIKEILALIQKNEMSTQSTQIQ